MLENTTKNYLITKFQTMKKVFTLALVMAMTITSFAQVKGIQRKAIKDMQPVQAVSFTGLEDLKADFPASTRSIMTAPEEFELSFTAYDWQSNAAARNFTAVWPDGYAVMCYTQATNSSYTDRGTGLAIWDPAVGEWEFTEARVEGVKTGFGAITRYKQNGLAVAAHTASDCRIFLVEDFRSGNRDFGEGIIIPTTGEDGRTYDPCWPAIQCSGSNLDVLHIMTTEYTLTDPFENALLYSRYENGEFTVLHRILPNLDADHMGGGGSNIMHFLQYDPAKPNRVSFVLTDAWTDGRVIVSEDGGNNWNDRTFYHHPGIHTTFEETFCYPRWVDAHFDANDNINLVYEWNGSTGEPGSGSYYPTLGGVGFWSETLPKNAMCVGGIGEVGGPFVMDTSYIYSDLYYSEWYWSDALHDPLPEYFGELMILDEDYNVVPYDGEAPDTYYWINLELKDHGAYNSGIAAFPSMVIDGDKIYAVWSMIAGDCATVFFDGANSQYRLFGSMSYDGGQTWTMPVHLITDIMDLYDEMVYPQLIPYVYSDNQGEYVWLCYQNDQETGTFVQGDESVYDNNFYRAVKIYVNTFDGVTEEPTMMAENMISVYPNPAQGAFRVALNNESNVNIYNAIGQLVKTYNNVTEVSVNLEAGVYFVNAGNETVKVVVK